MLRAKKIADGFFVCKLKKFSNAIPNNKRLAAADEQDEQQPSDEDEEQEGTSSGKLRGCYTRITLYNEQRSLCIFERDLVRANGLCMSLTFSLLPSADEYDEQAASDDNGEDNGAGDEDTAAQADSSDAAEDDDDDNDGGEDDEDSS